MVKFWKKPIYLMDENVKMSSEDIERLGRCIIINSTKKFPKGTDDSTLITASRSNKWIIVTKDIRMALRALECSVPIVYISDDEGTIKYMKVRIYGRSKYPSMFDYLTKRFGSTSEET